MQPLVHNPLLAGRLRSTTSRGSLTTAPALLREKETDYCEAGWEQKRIIVLPFLPLL